MHAPTKRRAPVQRGTRRRRRGQAGITVVEASLLIAIAGVLLAVVIPTFMQKVQVSRISEAGEQLDQMYIGILAYHGSLQHLDAGPRMGCFPPPAGPTPAVPTAAGLELDFFEEGVPGAATWRALEFNPEGVVRYSYTFLPAQEGCEVPDPAPPVIVRWRAEGDLDGDGELSTFERSASLDGDQLLPEPLLLVQRRTE